MHAGARARPAIAALWRLDVTLGRVVTTTTQPMVGQMRLTWWHTALSALSATTAQAQPELDTVAQYVLARGTVTAADLAALVEGWEALLDPMPLADAALAEYATQRGTRLFALSAKLLGAESDDAAGAGWALADFGLRCSHPATASRALALAQRHFDDARAARLPRPLRILTRLASADVAAAHRLPRTAWRLWRSL